VARAETLGKDDVGAIVETPALAGTSAIVFLKPVENPPRVAMKYPLLAYTDTT
jgi:hypothetical protein